MPPLEATLRDLFFEYPYLLGEDWPQPAREVKISEQDRVDLLFTWPDHLVVVEFKRGKLKVGTLDQLKRYLKTLRQTHPEKRVEGILIGREASEPLRQKVKRSKLAVSILLAGQDVPDKIVICKKCRLAYDARLDECPRDGCTDVLAIHSYA